MNKFTLMWIDLEMSGLHPIKNRILQFACILSDSLLTSQEVGPCLVINCEKQHLNNMDEWNTKHHNASGLVKKCLQSKISIQDAEQIILQFLLKNHILKGQLVVAGNSVHIDKFFMFHQMPRLYQFLHYRILDVSSISHIVRCKLPKVFFKKQLNHRALDDIKQSIGQLKLYLVKAFK